MIAREKTKLVMRVVVSLLSKGCPPLRDLNNNMESKVPVTTDTIIMITLL